MKVIFLDIDGVLNSERLKDTDNEQVIDRYAVNVLKQIIDQTDATIVLSSGWRFWFDDNMEPQEENSRQLYDILNEYGLRLSSKTSDFCTEEIRINKTFSHVKAQEIKAWINEHPQVEKYVVLDDLDLRNKEINAHLVRINGKIGLTVKDAKRVIGRLHK